MGIHGLTSYISSHAEDYLTDFKLGNCLVLIDGNSAASLIYSTLSHSNHAFGGDYDKYNKCTIDFIEILKKCKIHPIFIFDGGYELRKLKTVLERIKMNVIICGQYKNKYRESRTFPLLLKEDFKAILRNQNISVIQCDFEADHEITILARILKCPIISCDSDYYINDVIYIPFTSIEFRVMKLKKKTAKCKYYIPCKKFNIDIFLNHFGGLSDKSLLPLLSCILGNDYIPPNTFKNFLTINYFSKFDERIQKIIKWMKEITSVDEAIAQMMATVKKNKIKIEMIIRQMLREFSCNTSQFLKYVYKELQLNKDITEYFNNLSISNDFINTSDDNLNYNMNSINSTLLINTNALIHYKNDDDFVTENEDKIVLDVQKYEISNNNCDIVCDQNEETISYDKYKTFENGNVSNDNIVLIKYEIPDWFLEKYRLGFITPNIINIINFQRIFIPSQSEDYYSRPSHEICLPILKCIAGIVLKDKSVFNKIKCHARIKNMQLGVYDIVPVTETDKYRPLPDLLSIGNMDIIFRKNVLLDCLNISDNLNFELFPEEWKLFIIILIYWKKNCKQTNINESHIRSIIICLIYLNIIDSKIGFIRTSIDLKKYCKENLKRRISNDNISECEINNHNQVASSDNLNELKSFINIKNNVSVADFHNFVSKEDCLKAADILLPYHQINSHLLKNRKEFNVKLVHSFAQLQHCVQNILTLNAILNFPFMPCHPHSIFSGTFLYNLFSELHSQKSSDNYINGTLLAKTSTIIILYKYLITSWEIISVTKKICPKLEIKKKKKKEKNLQNMETIKSEDATSDSYYDPDNIYSKLSLE
ncbi:hypothetical protein PGB90_007666 [Kerria lacca]